MTKHLSPDQISAWLADERTEEMEQHVANCAECQAELAAFEGTLSEFRKSAETWAEHQCPPHFATIHHIRRAPYRSALRSLSLVIATAVICILAFVGVLHHPAASPAAQTQLSDAALLQQVNSQLSQNVPSSLTPLDSFVSWENSSASATQATSRQ